MRGRRQGIYTYRYVEQEAANYCIQGRQTHFWKTFYSLRGARAILLAAIRSLQRNSPTFLLPFLTWVCARTCPRDPKRQRPYQFGCKETGLFCLALHAPQPVQPRRSRKQVIWPKLQIIQFFVACIRGWWLDPFGGIGLCRGHDGMLRGSRRGRNLIVLGSG